jgi:hypothetical protein
MRHVLRLVVLLALPLTLRGHDTWLVPDGFFLQANSAVRVRLATSEEFPTSDSPADVSRAARGQTDSPGRERYRKITKGVLCVGETRDSLYAQPEGLWLEVVPEQSPCRLKAGDTLGVRILFEGRPLAGTHVSAGYKGTKGHQYPVTVKTDTAGRAEVKLTRAGAWFIRAHHIVPTREDREADWESAFSTLTFEVRP